MKLDANAVRYQLAQSFDDVVCITPPRSTLFDYPLLYDTAMNMSGHTVLVPEHERPHGGPSMQQVLCVCLSDESTAAACAAGLAVVQIRGGVTFQHLYNQMQQTYVRNERLDARLHAHIDAYAGFSAMLDSCARTLGYSCTLIDDKFRAVCSSVEGSINGSPLANGERKAEHLDGELVDLFMASREYRRMREGRRVFLLPGHDTLFMRNVFFGQQLVGALVMQHVDTVESARYVRFLLNYLAPLVEEMYARIGSFEVASKGKTSVRAAFRAALAGEPGGAELLESLLAEKHADVRRYLLMQLERSFTNEGVQDMGYVMQRIEAAWPNSYCVQEDEKLFALLVMEGEGAESPQSFLPDLPETLRDNLVKAGTSRRFLELDDIPNASRQAHAALECGKKEDPFYWYYRFEDYAFDWLLARSRTAGLPGYACHPAVNTLARYDEANGTQMLETLVTFVRYRYNATLAAGALFVARSTLLNRLARIVELTQIDLDDFRERVYLEVSLLMAGCA